MKAILLLLMLAGSVSAQSVESRVVLYSGTAFDLGTTEALMRTGRYREMNPVLGQHPARRIGTVVGVTVGLDLMTRLIGKQGHPRLASGLNFAIGGVHFVVGGINLR